MSEGRDVMSSAENGAGWDRRSDPSVRAMIDAEKRALSAENDAPPCCRYCGEPGGDCGFVCC